MVGVAGVVLVHGSVLLVKRGREPMRGGWSLPGGVLELGEAIAAGVAREVWEETGIEVRSLELVEVVDRILRDGEGRVRYHYVLHDWLCTPSASDSGRMPSPVAGTDADAAVWAPLGGLTAFCLDERTRAVIERAAGRAGELGIG